jgi:transcriptional regulator with XRE-family HTH domain
MDAARLIRSARHAAGLTLRELAAAAGTSHSTLAAYETGAKTPTVDTLDRIVAAAGFRIETVLVPAPDAFDHDARGRELADLLELADALTPTRA